MRIMEVFEEDIAKKNKLFLTNVSEITMLNVD